MAAGRERRVATPEFNLTQHPARRRRNRTDRAHSGRSSSERPDPSRNTLRLNPSPNRCGLQGRGPGRGPRPCRAQPVGKETSGVRIPRVWVRRACCGL